MANITIKPKSLHEIKIIAKKAIETAKIDFKSQVVAVFDVSGSMEDFYRSGIIDGLTTRILGLGLHLDDNGSIPVYALDSGVKRLPDLTEKNVDKYTQQLHKLVGGGTDYAPSINKVVDDAGAGDTMLVLFFTDGDNSDHKEAEEAIVKASKLPIFFQMYGIYRGRGPVRFPFLEDLDYLSNRRSDLRVDNCGFSPLSLSINASHATSDEDDAALYEDMLKEYKDFPAKALAAGVSWGNKRRKFLGIF